MSARTPDPSGGRNAVAPLGAVVGPVAGWAVAAVTGALAGELVTGSGPTGLVVAVAGVGAVLVAVGLLGRDRPVAAGLMAVVAVAAVTAGGTMVRVATTDLGLLPALAASGGTATMDATVVAEPRPIARGWQVLVRIDAVAGTATRERAALVLDDEPPVLGQLWTLDASARPLPEGGYGRWLARQHAAVALDPARIEPGPSPGVLARASEHVRSRVRLAATRHLGDATGGLLIGFVTGDRRVLPDADQEAMRATGLTHLTAVSGSNVAIVLAGVLGLSALLRLRLQLRWVLVAAMLPWFAFVTRFEPSVSRASTMAAILLLVSVRGRLRDARHALGAAVLVLLVVDPRLAGSLGLLLSAVATGGVLVVAPLVRRRLPSRLPRRLAELAAITIGAQVAVVPLLLATFGEVGLASIPANLVAVPFAAIAATTAFLGTVVALVHVGAGAWLFAAAAPGAEIVLAAAHGFAGMGGIVTLDQPASVVALVAGCVWVVVRRRSVVARLAAGGLAVALVLTVLPGVEGRLPPTVMTVTAIDVGQGDAFLIESPGARILVDAGQDEVAARWLRRHGRTRLDLVVVTHPHLDHVGGVPEVLRRVDVGAVWSAPVPTPLPAAREVHEVAADRGVPVRAPVAGEVARVGDLVVEVLHPSPGRPHRHARSELNEMSYVLRIVHPSGRVLLAGDVELEAQAELLAHAAEQLRAEVFAVPHHGSSTTDPAFLAAIGGRTGIISAGRDNRHGHPHADTLSTLEELGVEVRRTDLEGTVVVEVDGPVREPVGAGTSGGER